LSVNVCLWPFPAGDFVQFAHLLCFFSTHFEFIEGNQISCSSHSLHTR
jgi:hypothetical protein